MRQLPSYLNDLNVAQYRAATLAKGPVMVIAGPGSGKTKLILSRLFYLTNELSVDPDSILTISFTRKASSELRSRIRSFPAAISSVKKEFLCQNVFTFHSFFLRILTEYKAVNDSSFADSSVKISILQNVILKNNFPVSFQNKEEFSSFAEMFLHEVSCYKNIGEAYETELMDKELFLRIYEAYETEMLRQKKADYDDFALLLKKLLQDNPYILRAVKARYRYICIDEFQDINKIQYDIVKMITDKDSCICVVGDDDQSIYAFRGSHTGAFRLFLADYLNPETIYLKINYRSDKAICRYAKELIQHNSDRLSKDISAFSANEGVVSFQKLQSNAELPDSIEKIMREKKEETIAVLTRSNKEKDYLFDIIRPKFETSMEEKEYEKLIVMKAVMDFAEKRRRKDLLLFLAHFPFLPEFLFTEEIVDLEMVGKDISRRKLPSLVTEEFERLWYFVKRINEMTVYELMAYLEYSFSLSLQNPFSASITRQEFTEYLAKMKPKARTYKVGNTYFLTAHSSKGLEFDTVILPTVNERNYPKKVKTLQAKEEERRLFYVAMTRAKHQLYLLYTDNAKEGMKPSEFLYDMKAPFEKGEDDDL